MEQMGQQKHIVMLTFPSKSHITPVIALAKLLIPHGFTFTIAIAVNLADKIRLELNLSEEEADPFSAPNNSPIKIAPLTFSNKPPAPGAGFGDFSVFEFLISTRPSFEKLLEGLESSRSTANGHGSAPPPVTCIVADWFNCWCPDVASQFKIPIFGLLSVGGHVLSAFLHSKAIKDHIDSIQDLDQIIDFIPGYQPMTARDLLEGFLGNPSFAMDVAKTLPMYSGLILNTVLETERMCLEAIKDKIPQLYAVPLLMLMDNSMSNNPVSPQNGDGGDKAPPIEEVECMKWLDSKPTSSVVFVSFGSFAQISHEQMRELAIGLDNSNQAFLWVIRADQVSDDSALSKILPDGFLDKTKDRGYIMKWAPQVKVLSHPAVGGFITHCGWNSVMENLSLGAVPMICWPQVADHKIICRVVVDLWNVGLELKVEKGLVKAETIEESVKRALGDVGKQLKENALKAREIFQNALKEDGSSQHCLRGLIHDFQKL